MGRITFPDGIVYEGGVVDGRPRGRARISFPDGSRYEGGLRKLRGGEFPADSSVMFPVGESYDFHGDGVITFPTAAATKAGCGSCAEASLRMASPTARA